MSPVTLDGYSALRGCPWLLQSMQHPPSCPPGNIVFLTSLPVLCRHSWRLKCPSTCSTWLAAAVDTLGLRSSSLVTAFQQACSTVASLISQQLRQMVFSALPLLAFALTLLGLWLLPLSGGSLQLHGPPRMAQWSALCWHRAILLHVALFL